VPCFFVIPTCCHYLSSLRFLSFSPNQPLPPATIDRGEFVLSCYALPFLLLCPSRDSFGRRLLFPQAFSTGISACNSFPIGQPFADVFAKCFIPLFFRGFCDTPSSRAMVSNISHLSVSLLLFGPLLFIFTYSAFYFARILFGQRDLSFSVAYEWHLLFLSFYLATYSSFSRRVPSHSFHLLAIVIRTLYFASLLSPFFRQALWLHYVGMFIFFTHPALIIDFVFAVDYGPLTFV